MKIVFLDASTVGDVDLESLESIGEWTAHGITGPGEVIERLAGADIAISNKVFIGAETFAAVPSLRLVAVAATGTNNVDLEAAKAANVQVCNVRGYSTESVAQHAIAAVLNLATNMHRYVSEPEAWADSPIFTRLDYPVVAMAGRTLGLIGVGNIGGRVGEIAEALGMKIQCFARPGSSQLVHPEWDRVSLEQLFSTSDVVSLHCPLTEETRNLINETALAQMKSGAFLINTGRGELIDEAALLSCLQSGKLGGAGVDVLCKEPPPADHPLLRAAADLPNLLITPHTGWSSRAARQELINRVAGNIAAFLESGEVTNRVA